MIFHPRKRIEPHLLEALDLLRFEMAAWRFRLFRPKRLATEGRHYLQIGCYDTRLDGFLNTDFFLNKAAEAHIDARFPLPFAEDAWQGVYAHHVVEHLSYPDALSLMAECRRVLLPGGVFRMIVPDLEVFLRLYGETAAVRTRIFRLYPDHIMSRLNTKTPLEVIDHIFRDDKFN